MICYHARWVLPISVPPIPYGTVACDDGVIHYVGPRSQAPAGESHDLGNALLLPGLINTHTHLELTAMRGFLEELSFPLWIDTLRRARNEILTDDTLLDSAKLGIYEGLERGITTYADTSSSGVVLEALRETQVRGIMYQEVFGPHPDTCDAAMDDLRQRVDRLRPNQTALVALGVSPHAPYTVSDRLYRAAAQFAVANNLPMAMHIAESADEDDLIKHGHGEFAERFKKRGIPLAPRSRSPIALLADLDALPARTLLIHAVRADADDIVLMQHHNCAVAHCPASNAKLGHGIAPLKAFLDAGLDVGLGSDSVASNNRMDILEEVRLATLFQSAHLGSPTAIPAATALELATIRGARALGLETHVGSLDPGKAADLAAFPLDALCTTPSEDPVATAVYALSGTRASLVTVAGRHLVEDSRLVTPTAPLCRSITQLGQALAASR